MVNILSNNKIKKWLPYAVLLLVFCLGYFLHPFLEKGADVPEEYEDLLEKYRQDSIPYNQLFGKIEQMNDRIDNQIWLHNQSLRKQDEIIDKLKKQNESIQEQKGEIDSILNSLNALDRFDRITRYFKGD